MDSLPPRVLVTGAAGWLGLNLVTALVRGLADHPATAQPRRDLRIRCLVRPGESVTPLLGLGDGIELVEGTLTRDSDLQRFVADARGAVLFHTAGVIHPRLWAGDFEAINVRGSHRVLQAAARAGVRRAIVVSSNSPLGCNPHAEHLFDEASPYNPYMGYGRSKMQLEQLIAQWQASGRIETVVIRPPWFYGPHQPQRQTRFFKMVRDGRAPVVGNGLNRRSMAYTDNLCQGLLLAAITPAANGRLYWIADARPYTLNEIIATIEHLMENEFSQKCRHGRLRFPSWVGRVAHVADATLQGLGLYHQAVHVLSEMDQTIACDISLARRELNYQPRVDLQEGMRRSLQWCRNNGLLAS